jgi:hypothetical protein
MSDAEGDMALTNDSAIESALRDVVREATKQEEEITVNLARSRAEEKLGLHVGTLKSNAEWKKRSAQIVQDAFEEPPSPEQPKKSAPKPKAGSKRKSDDAVEEKTKRRKKSPVNDSQESEDAVEDAAEAPGINHEIDASEPKAATKPKSKPQSMSTSTLSSPPDTGDEEAPAILTKNEKGAAAANGDDDDESDLSSVIDDPPPKRKRQRKSDAKPAKTKTEKPAKSAKATTKSSKPEKEISPDEEEIKRLQGWLIKCGIRKMWHRELAACSTPKEKIKHLKGMLDEAGMTGRYSAEKAKQIKEQRELKAELEEAKKFNEQWGHEEEDGGDEGEGAVQKRSRLKPKGLVDFGDSGEDSD